MAFGRLFPIDAINEHGVNPTPSNTSQSEKIHRAARLMICKAVFEKAASSLSRLPSPNKQYWHRDASRSLDP
jgi:hypothetical protein